jgi:hypothetical protein
MYSVTIGVLGVIFSGENEKTAAGSYAFKARWWRHHSLIELSRHFLTCGFVLISTDFNFSGLDFAK